MAILGTLVKGGLNLSKRIKQKTFTPDELQKRTLTKLLLKSKNTAFGRFYDFNTILTTQSTNDRNGLYKNFSELIPIFNYDSIFEQWWARTLAGEANVTWPGKVHFFALSSGTSTATSKHIPLTKQMLKTIRQTGINQIMSLANFNFPESLFEKSMLMLGGSTNLHFNGTYYEGDLSGISANKIPFWFQHYYKPGKTLAQTEDWDQKLNTIAKSAHLWDIGYIVGVPSWIQLLIEKIITVQQVDNIHEVWPNLQVFCHGGVSFEPYKKGFEKLLGMPLTYIETYLASEGFIAFQDKPNSRSMKMVLNKGIFYEFIPFNEDNFDAEGEIKNDPKTIMIQDVKPEIPYAILMSTCAGAWRYLIGDVIAFTDVANAEIVIKGRTKHFLNLCGEHLSVDNMNKAIQNTANHFNIDIKEFTVAGIPYQNLFAHQWYIGTDDKVTAKAFQLVLDKALQSLNDDYSTERKHALKAVLVKILPTSTFYNWMEINGKQGGQHKFPRVLKSKSLVEWHNYLQKLEA
jgi:hypothetical protein